MFTTLYSISDLRYLKAKALSTYKTEAVTSLAMRKDQEIRILKPGNQWSWAKDERGNMGWVPSTLVQTFQVRANPSDLHNLNLQLWVHFKDQVQQFILNKTSDSIICNQCIFINTENSSPEDEIRLILENNNKVIGRGTILMSQVDNLPKELDVKLQLEDFALVSCVLNFKFSGEVLREEGSSRSYVRKMSEMLTDDPNLLAGEFIEEESDARGFMPWVSCEGVLCLTNYRFLFKSRPPSEYSCYLNVPLTAIESHEVREFGIKLICKDLRVIEFTLPNFNILRKFQDRMNENSAIFFCIDHFSALQYQGNIQYHDIYDPQREFHRIGALDNTQFRICNLNSDFNLCDSYPTMLIQPVGVTDKQIKSISKFRSRRRIPSLCWCNNSAAIYRSAQPLVGIFSSRNKDDEKYMLAAKISYIVDARPKVNARANKVAGKGYEHSSYYPNCRILFMNIHNIHKVRASYEVLRTIFEQDDDNFYIILHNSRWLHHLKSILLGAKAIADIVICEKASVLIHCSDGWDRTSQLSALAQLLIDPFYRTYHGFQVLIEKEWLHFGHRFRERTHGNERSPVFVQFLDCVYQIMNQFPMEFQFSNEYLLFLADAVYSGLYGTFMSDNEKQALELNQRTINVWVENRPGFFNPGYSPTSAPILTLRVNFHYLKLWDFFTRWNLFQDGCQNFYKFIRVFSIFQI